MFSLKILPEVCSVRSSDSHARLRPPTYDKACDHNVLESMEIQLRDIRKYILFETTYKDNS